MASHLSVTDSIKTVVLLLKLHVKSVNKDYVDEPRGNLDENKEKEYGILMRRSY
ncbi:MAG: hypothetical protein ACI9FN_001975 [Saprospiraceae bacterium]|jgi:hypothetical protein